MNEKIIEKLSNVLGEANVLQCEAMARHTTFRIGGPADVLVTPHSEEEILEVVSLCRAQEVPLYVVGNGSNLLVGDKGIRGVVLQLYKNWNNIVIEGTKIRAQAGAMLAAVSKAAQRQGLSGLVFASGIPGTIGGAVMMNAGAYGGEMKDVVKSVRVLTKEGTIREIPGDQMDFGYRSSVVEREGYIVLETTLELTPSDTALLQEQMEELRIKRQEKQPLELPSAGSTFKRPEGYFAGKLIMDAGLRGFTVGGAQVSEKHCGFVVNVGGATAADVVSLMDQVSEKVFDQFGVRLEPEVKRVGEF